MWLAVAKYEDGTSIEQTFPYQEDGNYNAECDRQHDLEEWLVTRHDGCTYYSVVYIEPDEE